MKCHFGVVRLFPALSDETNKIEWIIKKSYKAEIHNPTDYVQSILAMYYSSLLHYSGSRSVLHIKSWHRRVFFFPLGFVVCRENVII